MEEGRKERGRKEDENRQIGKEEGEEERYI
jgi:hypothetical protein